jgi:hypothetical protein
MQIPEHVHRAQPWRIHALIPDFRLVDVWALPARGTREEFADLVDGFAGGDTAASPSRLTRVLFQIRWTVGGLLGWDRADDGIGGRVTSLRERLPEDLRDAPPGPAFSRLPFEPLYRCEDECAAEVANRTMHGVLHLGWAPTPAGDFQGQMAVYVRTNGRFGDLYMAAIDPFRHRIVYPSLMRQIEANWRARPAPAVQASAS